MSHQQGSDSLTPASYFSDAAMPSSEGTFSYRCPVGHQVKSRKALVEGLYIEMQKVDKDIAAIWVSNDAGVEMDPDDVKITVQNKATHEFVMKMGNRFPVTWTDSYVVLVCGVPRLRIDSARQHTLVFM